MSNDKPLYIEYYTLEQKIHADAQQKSWEDMGLKVVRNSDRHSIVLRAYPPE